MKNIAVILAGGKGRRLNSDIPKQFVKVVKKLLNTQLKFLKIII